MRLNAASHAFIVEGHADERGTREYSIALGARRAQTVRESPRRYSWQWNTAPSWAWQEPPRPCFEIESATTVKVSAR
jgi:hypothetical protein